MIKVPEKEVLTIGAIIYDANLAYCEYGIVIPNEPNISEIGQRVHIVWKKQGITSYETMYYLSRHCYLIAN